MIYFIILIYNYILTLIDVSLTFQYSIKSSSKVSDSVSNII